MPLQTRATPPEGASYYSAGFLRQTLAHGDLVVARTFQAERRPMRDNSHTAETFGIQDAILCTVHLKHMDPGHTWWDGRHLPTSEMTEGSLHVHDLRYNWTSELIDAFDCVHFSFPQTLLRAVVLDDQPDSRIEIAARTFDAERTDQTLLHLARSLLPGLARPQEVSRLFADHVISAAAAHFTSAYGSVRLVNRRNGRLAPWQQARVLEYLAAHLDTDITVSELRRDLLAIVEPFRPCVPGHHGHAAASLPPRQARRPGHGTAGAHRSIARRDRRRVRLCRPEPPDPGVQPNRRGQSRQVAAAASRIVQLAAEFGAALSKASRCVQWQPAITD
ncbi:hypothetical protein LJR016_002926 [Devosia sp. LjRoot16]|uniref:hypothetical protein n=1 Tax=Devosia sp. LjRoot16 TaxID=3342271 RepID=UPI003ECF49BF